MTAGTSLPASWLPASLCARRYMVMHGDTVAALQAQNAKMLRVVADIHDATGNMSAAAERRQQASAILAAIQEKLYVQGQGVFATLYPSNASKTQHKRVAVRTCLDFMDLL